MKTTVLQFMLSPHTEVLLARHAKFHNVRQKRVTNPLERPRGRLVYVWSSLTVQNVLLFVHKL